MLRSRGFFLIIATCEVAVAESESTQSRSLSGACKLHDKTPASICPGSTPTGSCPGQQS